MSAIGSEALESEIPVRLAVVLKVSTKELLKYTCNFLLPFQDSESEHQINSWRGERIEWCLDHGFEYVEINCADIVEGNYLKLI